MGNDARRKAAILNSIYDMFEVVSNDGKPTKSYGKYGVALRYARLRASRGESLSIIGIESRYDEDDGSYEFHSTTLASC